MIFYASNGCQSLHRPFSLDSVSSSPVLPSKACRTSCSLFSWLVIPDILLVNADFNVDVHNLRSTYPTNHAQLYHSAKLV